MGNKNKIKRTFYYVPSVIEELDSEGISLSETRENLIHQGYGWYWDFWVGHLIFIGELLCSIELAKQSLKRVGLI